MLLSALAPQDGKWSKEGKMSAPLHDNNEDAPYGLCHRGWLVCEQRVQCGDVLFSEWFFLEQFCFVRLLAT